MTERHLPSQPTPFVGRETELAEITDLLATPACRLLTLTGPGGIGKTRLAIEAARGLADDDAGATRASPLQPPLFANGVYFVPFQPLTSPDFIVSTIADSLNFAFYGEGEPKMQLLHYLRDKHLLLVLDNFEHLLESVDLLPEILEHTPGVKLLVTSRERLRLREEWMVDVHGLPFPEQDAGNSLNDYSAVRLFVESARRAGYAPAQADTPSIIRICQLVEGMPLALELAAVWVRAMPCAEIAREIEHSLDILTTTMRNVPEKHRSIRAAFEHSWQLLSEEEQTVFRKLSVFRGGCTREAAEQVTGASLSMLASLVDKSLLRVDTDGRYSLQELLRQYAEERLETSGEAEVAHDTHCAHYADFIQRRVEDIKGRRQLETLIEVAADFENVRTAWVWAAARRCDDYINTMVEGLWLFCTMRSRDHEGRALFRYAEQQFAGLRRPERQQVWGRILSRSVDKTEAHQSPQLAAALQIARRHHDLAETAHCLNRLGLVAYANRDYAKAKQLLEQSLACYRRLGDRYYVASALFDLNVHSYDADWEEKMTLNNESLRLAGEIGDKISMALALGMKAIDVARMGNYAEAERLWHERIAVGKETGNRHLVALGYAHLSYQVYFMQGEFSKTRAAAEEALRIAAECNHVDAAGWTLVTLSLVASMDEQYEEGSALCQQAASSVYLAHVINFAAWGSSIAACGLGDYKTASKLFPEALSYCVTIRGLVGIIMCLPVAALIRAHQGDRARAVELLALAFTHPVRASGWMERWPLLARLRNDLQQALGAEGYAAAWERGRLLDLQVIAVELQEQFGMGDTLSKEIAVQSSHRLPDLLTERELEILRLLADGLNSREAAQRLYLSVGTIRWYLKQIYSKLGAHSRSEAIACARELNLLV